MKVDGNSMDAYNWLVASGLHLSYQKQVLRFLMEVQLPFARFQLMELLGIKESTLCGILNTLEKKKGLLENVGNVLSPYGRKNKLYLWTKAQKKESPQKQLFLAI